MNIIREYEIQFRQYHGEVLARIIFNNNGIVEETNLYSISELNNIIKHYRDWETDRKSVV